MIEEKDFPGHFIGADRCRWWRHTRVGSYRVSSVGEWYPMGSREQEDIGYRRAYETMVFSLGPDGAVTDWNGLHCRGAFSREESNDIHEGFVSYYARRA